ncbi:Transcriptional regulator, MerR family [Granulibacter bethesdensis]|uniref:helix-turn-helix domain-containing protein n=1 Tax=Granulibacter bethesdensis TaxID=364410 RepID=UPI00090BBD87|nr:helix-turn-helix transcriptional regulator [Granulibacter bethesdensis]APH56287.1 Transcriptional regulator, MerR family [Granulibacter bethesdensis]
MSRPLIGRTVRRLRQERGESQQSLAVRLGISASYLNLIEHDQRGVTASLLIKLAETLRVDLRALSGQQERHLQTGLREVFADPMLANESVSVEEVEQLAAASPNAARAILTLYRSWRVAREDAGGIALPSGRRILLPNEEVRDLFAERQNYFAELEAAAGAICADLRTTPAEANHAIAERLRARHGLTIRVGPSEGVHRRYDPSGSSLFLSEQLPRESRGFHMAFQLALMEIREAVEGVITTSRLSTPEAEGVLRIGLLNYSAAAILMPYEAFRHAALELRHDMDLLAARFCVSFEQACQRLASLQRPEARGVPFFFLRTDAAGNVSKRFSAAGFPFARFGGSCPRWVVHEAFTSPGAIRVQVARLPDGATFLCFARCVRGVAERWGDPPPLHVVAMGCDIAHAPDIIYGDGIDIERAAVGIGLSCRLCDRQDCRSRAFPPLEHRIALDPNTTAESPYRFQEQH